MDHALLARRSLVGLLLLDLLTSSELVFALLRNPLTILGLVVFLHLTLLTGSLIGLLLRLPWGFYLVYILVPFSTVLLSISFVPLVPGLLPVEIQWVALTLLNAAVLSLAAFVHLRGRRLYVIEARRSASRSAGERQAV